MIKSPILLGASLLAACGEGSPSGTALSSMPGHTATFEEAVIPADFEVGAHKHPGTEINHVISGEVTIQYEGEAPFVASAGDSYTVPAEKVHRVKIGPEGATVAILMLQPDGEPSRVMVERDVDFPE